MINVLDLNQSINLATSANTNSSSWPIPMDKIRNPKRLKQASSTDGLQFRDHIWAYNQRYLAIEAMEEATTAMMRGDHHQQQHLVSYAEDEIKLVQ